MEGRSGSIRDLLVNNLATKLISLVVAVVLWVVVLGSRNVEVSKEVPVEVLTPSNMVVANEVPEKLTFRLSGPKAFLRALLDRREEPIQVNLVGSKPGLVTYRFFSDHIRVPIGVKVLSVSPASILIKLEQIRRREVPIRIVTEGELPEGLVMKSLTASPETVTIKGPESRIDGITEVPSVPLRLAEVRSSFERELALNLNGLGVQLEGDLPKIRGEIEGLGANFKIKNIEVRVITSYRTKVVPPVVTAWVRATPEELKRLSRSKVFASVDASDLERGTHEVSPVLALPENVTPVRVSPEKVKLTLY